MKVHGLTTIDNPFNPFDEFESWFNFDQTFNHNCSQILARVTESSSELPEGLQVHDIEVAIDEIIEKDLEKKFKKVSKEI